MAIFKRVRRLLARLWREHTTPSRLGLAVGVGVLIGCSPFYGLHFWIGLLVALALRLNKVAVFLGAQISIPPFVPVIVYACVQLGALLTRGQPLLITVEQLSQMDFAELARTFFFYWLAGWPVVGSALGLPLGLLGAWYVRRRRARAAQQPPDPEVEADLAWDELLEQLSRRYARCPRRHRHQVYFKARMDPAYRQVCELLDGVEEVVDLGTGQGVLPVLLALGARSSEWANREGGMENGKCEMEGAVRFTGIEWDEGKLAAGRIAAEELATVRLEQGDIRDFEIKTADAVVLMDVLHHYPQEQQRQLIARAAAALRPGGRLVIRETDRARRSWLTRQLEAAAVRLGWNRGPLCYRTAEELQDELREHGLRCQQAPSSSSVHRGNLLIWGHKQ